MRAEIITSGTELLLGDTLDTNAAYLSRQLRALGINVHYRTTVGDNEERMATALTIALERSDLVITTGGLGPTVDDVTRQAVARATGRPLELHPELLAAIEERFRSFGSRMTENNRQQAYVPQGAIVIENPVGTAPSFVVEAKSGVVISLPGVPREMEYLFLNAVVPYLRGHFHLIETIKTRVLKTAAIGESAIDDKIGDLMQSANPTVGLSAHPGQTDVRITAKAATDADAEGMIAEMETRLRERLGDSIYGIDEQTLQELLLELLHQRGETVAVAEMVTLGELSRRLAGAPNSAPFKGGVVLGAEDDLVAFLSGLGLPSSETPTACELAEAAAAGVRKQFGCTYGLAVARTTASDGAPEIGVALAGPSGKVCQSTRRLVRDSHGRIWIAVMALNMLRKQLLEPSVT